MTLHRATQPYDWTALLRLIQTEFAYMAGRISPPSSMLALTEAHLQGLAATSEIWVIGAPPIACIILTAKTDSLYLGKLAVAANHRGRGHARALIAQAAARARSLGLPALTLQTRVELVENHAAFAALGFHETGRSAHPGFARPTTVEFRLPLSAQIGLGIAQSLGYPGD
jgi:GNAT superfamily N-acetyltransferase